MLVAAGIISRAALSVYISNCRLLTRNEKQHPGSAPVFAEKTGSSADAEICRFCTKPRCGQPNSVRPRLT
ncbi:hypothetical protein, partial [Faecalibaculum rodentium]|uniref:hypothetical protein n=1 Tax=Faecalibaculum rodentium TaxID=1702221 RepID=UPI003F7403C8